MGNCFALHPLPSHQMPVRSRSFDGIRGPSRRKRYRVAPHNMLPSPSDDLRQHYELGKELGKGQFGTIRHCIHRITGNSYACKSISKLKLTCQEDREDLRREIDIMYLLRGHPNIVELKEVFEDKAYVHIIMELCQGGELFDRIINRQSYPEKEAALLIKSLVEVIQYCHQKGVIHRDLKPENILFASTSLDSPIKLADYGLALNFNPGQKFSGMAGSAYYIAPEVLNGCYSHEVDLWSIGIILYVLLSGVPPFWGETEKSIFAAIKEGKFDLVSDPWPRISQSAKHLIRGLLCPDPKVRFTSDEVLKHPWILHHSLDPVSSQRQKNPEYISRGNSGEQNMTQILKEAATVKDSQIGGLEKVSGVHTQSRTFSLKKYTVARGSISTLPLQARQSELSFDAAKLATALRTTSCPSSLVYSPLQSHLSFSDLSAKGQLDDSTSSLSSCTSESTSDNTFDRWASFSAVAEPTMAESLAAIISNLNSAEFVHSRNWTQVRLKDGCSCTILKASKKKKLLIADLEKRKLLILYDRNRKRIGWKILDAQEAATVLDSIVA